MQSHGCSPTTHVLHALLIKLEWLQDNGKPYAVAISADVPAAASHFRYYAGWADKIQGKTIPVPPTPFGDFQAYTLHEPIGVCGLITRASSPVTRPLPCSRPVLSPVGRPSGHIMLHRPIEQQRSMPFGACKLSRHLISAACLSCCRCALHLSSCHPPYVHAVSALCCSMIMGPSLPTQSRHLGGTDSAGGGGAAFNFPLLMLTWCSAPALAAGCTIVCKVSCGHHHALQHSEKPLNKQQAAAVGDQALSLSFCPAPRLTSRSIVFKAARGWYQVTWALVEGHQPPP